MRIQNHSKNWIDHIIKIIRKRFINLPINKKFLQTNNKEIVLLIRLLNKGFKLSELTKLKKGKISQMLINTI